MKPEPHAYSVAEEIAHAITHGLGLMLSIAGLVFLVWISAKQGSVWHVVGSSVFGGSLVLTYASSTLYHSLPSPRGKLVFQKLDHSAIFLLIAGTYTPFMLVNLRGPWGWTILGIVWTLGIFGIVLQFLALRHGRIISMILYVALGWLIIVAIKPMIASIETGGLILVAAGGLVYTVGIIFYGMKNLRFHHAVWHVFVLAGSILHYVAVARFVV